jgi:hypothetical protein
LGFAPSEERVNPVFLIVLVLVIDHFPFLFAEQSGFRLAAKR